MPQQKIYKFVHHLTTCEKSIQRMVSSKCTCGLEGVLAEIRGQDKKVERLRERIQAMYAGDLSPESRLSGYKVITGELIKRRDGLLADNEQLSQELNSANEICGGLQENCEKLEAENAEQKRKLAAYYNILGGRKIVQQLEKLQAKIDLALLELGHIEGEKTPTEKRVERALKENE